MDGSLRSYTGYGLQKPRDWGAWMERNFNIVTAGVASILAVCAGLFCVGCSGQEPAPSSGETTHAPVIAAPTSDKTITVPAVFFGGVWESDPMAVLKDYGATDISKQDDGGCTATFSADDYAAFVERVYGDAKDAIDGLAASGLHPHVTAVDYDEQFATVTVTLDTTSLSAVETLLPFIPGEIACGYQEVAGLPVQCDVILVGPDGSNLLETLFPNDVGSAIEEKS